MLDISAASKPAALAAGDQAAYGFPRVYLDADVEIGADDLRALEAALQRPGVLAAGPEREFDMKGRPWAIRWYYDVWTRLPEVQRGLFGRGVIAVGERGHDRIAGLAPVIADDLAVSLAFKPQERAVAVQARVLIHPPRTVSDMLRRRVRVAEGLSQLEKTAGLPEPDASRTRLDDLLSVAKANPKMMPKVGLFLLVATVGRLRARRSVVRNDYSVWHRDESSRQ